MLSLLVSRRPQLATPSAPLPLSRSNYGSLLAWEWQRLTGGGWEEIVVQAAAGMVAQFAVFIGEPAWALAAIGLGAAALAMVAWLRRRLTAWSVAVGGLEPPTS